MLSTRCGVVCASETGTRRRFCSSLGMDGGTDEKPSALAIIPGFLDFGVAQQRLPLYIRTDRKKATPTMAATTSAPRAFTPLPKRNCLQMTSLESVHITEDIGPHTEPLLQLGW
ncbi:hypothetical protein J3459_006708 [Metarhizium acridum]|nr:hypothetical protein J3459_006708 [Metarhizium acridum]